MKVRSLFPALFSLAALPLSSVIAQTTQVGTMLVKQNDAGNAATSVTLTRSVGSSSFFTPVAAGSSRGDFVITFENADNVAAGTLITCVAENGRNNTAFGDTLGLFYATSSAEITGTNFYIPVNDSARQEEVNMNVAAGFFPYSRWLGGFARNASGTNDGRTNQLRSHASIRLGTEFRTLGSGVFLLDLQAPAVGGYSPTNGVLLVTHAKNEANYATSRANTDGTFNLYVRGNNATGLANEQDPIAFVYLPTTAVGTDGLVTLGRVNSNASTDVLAGPAQITKGPTGRWYLKVPGHSPETGTLFVSAEGGAANNFDNIISYQWDEANSRYIIESRDIQPAPNNQTPPPLPALQNGAAQEDMFSFAFFRALKAPSVSIKAPVNGDSLVAPATFTVETEVSDEDSDISKVEFLVNGVVVATDTAAPYELPQLALPAGSYRYTARATDTEGLRVTSNTVQVTVTLDPNVQLANTALWFDGVNDHLALGTAPELGVGGPPSNGFTLECWFRKEGQGVVAGGLGNLLPLISKGRGQADNSTLDINYGLGLTAGGLLSAQFEAYPVNGTAGGADFLATATHAPIVDGQWHHAAVTYNGNTGVWEFYLDGAPAGTVTGTVGALPRYDSIMPFGIATAFNSDGVAQGAFPGAIDEVRIWNYARSAAEILSHRDASTLEAGGLVGRFGLDEGRGLQMSGTSGKRTRGNLVNGPVWTAGAPLVNQAPQVSLAQPLHGARFLPGSTIVLAAAAADVDGSVAKVEFFEGTNKLDEVTTAPFVFEWTGVTAGSYTLTAVATDAAGLATTSDAVVVQVADISPLIISEVQSSQSVTAPAGAGDYWELTNTGAAPVVLSGYRWDDSRRSFATAAAWALAEGTSIGAGESVIFTKADPAAFRAWWGIQPTVQVTQSPGAPDLDANDSITLYDSAGVVVTTLSYGQAGFQRSNGLPSLGGHAGESAGGAATAALVWEAASGRVQPRYTFAGAGSNGGIPAVIGDDVGSPGNGGGPVQEPAVVLTLIIAPKIFSESATNPAALATLSRSGDTAASLDVTLSSSDVTEATVPASVMIPSGQASATFEVTAVNDFIFDGAQNVQIVALAPGATLARQELTVLDDADLPPPNLRLTEVQSNQTAAATAAGAADYWELTNFSGQTVVLDGYTWDDSRRDVAAAQAWKLPVGTSIAAGESIIITTADPAAFRAWWGLAATVQVLQTSGAPALDADDSITLYTGAELEVFTFSYAANGFTRSFELPSLGGHAGISAGGASDSIALVYDPASTLAAPRYLAANGYRLGGRISAIGADVGSPGVINGTPVTPPATEITTRGPLQFKHVSTIPLAGSEISAYDAASKRLFVTSSVGLQILAMNDAVFPVNLGTVDFTRPPFNLTSTDITSVAVRNGVVAVAVPHFTKHMPGNVVFLNAATGSLLSIVTVGVLPDMITFTPNGARVLTANEGEMQNGGADVAPGSVSIIEVAGGFTTPTVTTVGFAAFDSQAAALKTAGVRIFENPPGSGTLRLPSLDFEPEYIAVAPDSLTAMVTLQEANAVALLDLTTKAFTSVKPLGEKDFSTLLADFSDRDSEDGSKGVIKLTTGNPVFGLYMPDAITAFQANGQTYYVTANEGDDRDDFQTETIRVGAAGYTLDPEKFPNAAELKANNVLGRLTVSNSAGLRGDDDNDGDVDRILAYGGRSISILNASGEIVYDSADLIERLVASLGETWFDDSRSDNKAAEPEGVAIGDIEGRLYAFVGLERARGVMVFDITDPARVAQAGFVSLPTDANPEGITFIPGAQSPNGQPMIAVTNESSNTLSLFNVSRYTLQVLHFSDAEGGLLTPQTAPNVAALAEAFEGDYGNTLIVSGGDSFLPGPFLSAGADASLSAVAAIGATAPGRPDIAIHNLIGVEASSIGHHEWDLGSGVLAGAVQASGPWGGAQFPLLALNLDFSADAALSGLVTAVPLDSDDSPVPAAATQKGRLVPVTVVEKGGEKIGLVGVTTQLLASLSLPEGTVVKGGSSVNLDVLAGQIQPYVNELESEGVNKIVLLSHLGDLAQEQALAVKLSGVDIIVASGSNSRLGDSDDSPVAFPGHEGNFDGAYPVVSEDREGSPLLIVSTDSEHTYLGRLVVDFDLEGTLITSTLGDRVPENGAYAATAANVASAWGVTEANLGTTAFAAGTKGAQVKAVTEAVQAVLTSKDGVVHGYSAVYLEGAAPKVRSQETNLGNLTADANQQAVRNIVGGTEAIVSLKHAGGITGQVGAVTSPAGVVEKGPTLANAAAGKMAGGISQLDIENALRGNQRLMVFETSPMGLKALLEHGVSGGEGQVQFPQVGGVQFAWDPEREIGSRVVSIALLKDDGSAGVPVYKAGNLGSGMLPGAPSVIRVVTLNGLANGGAGYPMKANGENFRYVLGNGTLGGVVGEEVDYTSAGQMPANGVGEQTALAQHVRAQHGNLAQAYREWEVEASEDERIQNVKRRSDTVPPVAGRDSDGDGLSDLEEVLLGAGGGTVLRVGDYVDLNLGAFAGENQTLKIVGKLPAGVTFNVTTGRLSGTLGGLAALYDLQLLVMEGNVPVKAFNLQLNVEAFPARLLAGYEALLVDAEGLPKGILRLTATRPSLWTGSLEVIGQGRRAGTGSFSLIAGRQSAEIQMIFKGTATVPQANLTVAISAESPLVSGTFASGSVTGSLRGFRLASLGGSPPALRKMNLVLDAGVQDGIAYPAGFGWAKGSVTTKGAISFKGQLGDTQAITLTANLGVTGQALVWTQPYRNKLESYFGGVMPMPNVGQPDATVQKLEPGTWWFKAADDKELSYDAGFGDPLPVTPIATAFDTVKTSTDLEDVLDLTDSVLNVEIEGGGLSSTLAAPVVLPTSFKLASNFALTTFAPASGSAAWTGKVNKADGSLTGTLTLPASTNILAGKAAASAVLLQELSGNTVGAGLIRVPVPGTKKGLFRTSSLLIEK